MGTLLLDSTSDKTASAVYKMAALNKSNNSVVSADEKNRRVQKILNSPAFLKELDNAVEQQMRSGVSEDGAGALALQRHLSQAAGSGVVPKPIIPIDDIEGEEPSGYVKGEKSLRCSVASLYRLVDYFGWTQAIYNHITVRVSDEDEHFLLNPFGLLYHEVTASSLIKVNTQGQLIHGGSTRFGVNIAGFILHSAIHAVRPDAKCVVHVHHPAVVAVSAMKCGLLAVSQEYVLITTMDGISYHDFQGVLVDASERESIAKDLGSNKIMFLRNHGLVVLGSSVEEAFVRIYHVILACEAQVRMMSVGIDNLNIISEAALQRSLAMVRSAQEFAAKGMLKDKQQAMSPEYEEMMKMKTQVNWGIGDMDYEAWMRLLDSAGYRTGYEYKLPDIKVSKQ